MGDVHVKRELVFCVKVCVGKVAIHFGVCSRHGKPNTCQHVVGRDPVDVVLVDLCADDDAVLVVVFLALALAGALVADVLCPARGVLVLGHLVEVDVRVDGARVPAHETHGAFPVARRGREAAAGGDDVVGVVLRVAGARRRGLGHFERVALLQTVGVRRGRGRRRGGLVEGGRGRDAVSGMGDLQIGIDVGGLGLGLGRGRKVLAGLAHAVDRVHVAHLDLCGPAQTAVNVRLCAVDRGKVAVVVLVAAVQTLVGVGVLLLLLLPSAPARGPLFVRRAPVDSRGLGWAAVWQGLHRRRRAVGQLAVHLGSGRSSGSGVAIDASLAVLSPCRRAVRGRGHGQDMGRMRVVVVEEVVVGQGRVVAGVGRMGGHHPRLMDGQAHQRGSLHSRVLRRNGRSVGSQLGGLRGLRGFGGMEGMAGVGAGVGVGEGEAGCYGGRRRCLDRAEHSNAAGDTLWAVYVRVCVRV